MLSIRRIKSSRQVAEAMSFSLRNLTQLIDIDAIVVHTRTGEAVKSIAKFRPWDPIIAITGKRNIANETLLYWGVRPVYIKDVLKKEPHQILRILLNKKLISKNKLIVFTKGVKQEGVKFGSVDILKS
jgi:pyruvate kinase